jgi:hypothetical protein
MTPREHVTRLTLGLCGLIALGFTGVSVAGAAGEKTGGIVQGEGGPISPLPGASTGPTTGQPDEGKTGTKRGQASAIRARSSKQGTATPRKSPSSHAEKHPDYERMDSDNQKALKKENR